MRQISLSGLLVLVSLAGFACDDGHPAGPGPTERLEKPEVSEGSFALLEGRAITVDEYANGQPTTRREHLGRSPSGGLLSSMILACQQLELLPFASFNSEADDFSVETRACVARQTYVDRMRPQQAADTARYATSDQLLLLCTAHWAMQIAESVAPTYVFAKDGKTALLTSREIKPPLDQLFTDDDWLVDNTYLRYAIRPPSASDRASWALLASTLYRESAITGTALLSDDNCEIGLADAEVEDHEGTTVPMLEYLAANLVDALSSMMEAADKAQRHIGAAAAAKHSGSTSDAFNKVWRDRHDSRLEVASIYTPIAEVAFEETQLIPLWELRHGTAGGVDKPNYLLTTEVDTRPAGYIPNRIIGWVYPPNLATPPDMAVKLVTYASPTKPNMYLTTNQGETWARARLAPGSSTPLTVLRVEALLPREVSSAAADENLTFRYKQLATNESAIADRRYQFIREGESIPVGLTEVSHLFAFKMPDRAPHYMEGERFPVAAPMGALTREDQRAEEVIRSARVNPCMQGMGSWCRDALANTSSRDAFAIASDILRVRQAYGGSTTFNSVTAFLDQLGLSVEHISRAAKRIVGESEVLGRPITIDLDPNWPRAVDDPATDEAENLRPRRVFGTEPSAEPVSPHYLYARSAGRVTFEGGELDGFRFVNTTGLTVTATGQDSPMGQAYARTSVISTNAYIKRVLDSLLVGLDVPANQGVPYVRMLKEAAAFASAHGGPETTLYVRRNNSVVDRVSVLKLALKGLPYATTTAFQAACSVWLGEAGLKCALTGRLGTSACDTTKYKFLNPATGNSYPNTRQAGGFFEFGIEPTEAPLRLDQRSLDQSTSSG